LESLEEKRAFVLQAAATEITRVSRGFPVYRRFRRLQCAALHMQATQRMLHQRKAYRGVRAAVVLCQARRRSIGARRQVYAMKRKRAAVRLQSYQRCWLARKKLERARNAALRLQSAIRRMACRKQYLADLSDFKEQAKLENQVKALQAKLEATEREARSQTLCEPPAEVLDSLNALAAENSKLRLENERQRAEIAALRKENQQLRVDQSADRELLQSLKRSHGLSRTAGIQGRSRGTRKEKAEVGQESGKATGKGEDEHIAAAIPKRTLPFCPPLWDFWEDVESCMIPNLKNNSEVHIKIGSNILMVDDKDGKSVTWKCWMTRSKGYRRSMAFFVERRGVDGGIDREAEPQPQPEPADDGRLGAIFALRSALTGKYLVTSTE